MDVNEALSLFPAVNGPLEMLSQETYERQRLGAQVLADALRQIDEGLFELLKAVLVLRANTTVGQVSGYSLIYNEDLNRVADLLAAMLRRPSSIPRLPPPQPMDGSSNA